MMSRPTNHTHWTCSDEPERSLRYTSGHAFKLDPDAPSCPTLVLIPSPCGPTRDSLSRCQWVCPLALRLRLQPPATTTAAPLRIRGIRGRHTRIRARLRGMRRWGRSRIPTRQARWLRTKPASPRPRGSKSASGCKLASMCLVVCRWLVTLTRPRGLCIFLDHWHRGNQSHRCECRESERVCAIDTGQSQADLERHRLTESVRGAGREREART